ncbi:MAG: type II toxin-antitoxin system VapC family toxin [Candidatus Hydrogenedentes bacterium]|nr:type II toxin-antitoxin system VapC family toxin [Candidatus Hydrogenedentota bacterium]
MIAFDTCVLVRFLADDDPAQADMAEALMRENVVFLPRTVLLETEWVLRSRYGKRRDELLPFFRLLSKLDNVVLEDSEGFERAIAWYEMGADFADAMHLASSGDAVMHTFDQNFCRAASQSVETPRVAYLRSQSQAD